LRHRSYGETEQRSRLLAPMSPFVRLRAVAAPYFESSVDTNKLIPHRFVRRPLSSDYGHYLFFDERFAADGSENPDFVLNREAYRRARVLVSGRNFGRGAAEDGPVYALRDFGIRALIAPSYADIFRGNCVQNGVLPIVLAEYVVERLCSELTERPGSEVEIHLARQTVTTPSGELHRFEIDSSAKARLLEGLDDIGLTQRHQRAIERFETAYRRRLHWLSES
jgi:3-isopropylmalate/(R)-2-methylmalate dehydratase small subunit